MKSYRIISLTLAMLLTSFWMHALAQEADNNKTEKHYIVKIEKEDGTVKTDTIFSFTGDPQKYLSEAMESLGESAEYAEELIEQMKNEISGETGRLKMKWIEQADSIEKVIKMSIDENDFDFDFEPENIFLLNHNSAMTLRDTTIVTRDGDTLKVMLRDELAQDVEKEIEMDVDVQTIGEGDSVKVIVHRGTQGHDPAVWHTKSGSTVIVQDIDTDGDDVENEKIVKRVIVLSDDKEHNADEEVQIWISADDDEDLEINGLKKKVEIIETEGVTGSDEVMKRPAELPEKLKRRFGSLADNKEPEISEIEIRIEDNPRELTFSFIAPEEKTEVVITDQEGNELFDQTYKNFDGSFYKRLSLGANVEELLIIVIQKDSLFVRSVPVK